MHLFETLLYKFSFSFKDYKTCSVTGIQAILFQDYSRGYI